MMTIEEKLRMYVRKSNFVSCLADAFKKNPAGHTVADITYEVWTKKTDHGQFFEEFVVVHFVGGAKSYRTVNGNSNSANFRAIGALIDGGNYEEERWYDSLKTSGYELVSLRGE